MVGKRTLLLDNNFKLMFATKLNIKRITIAIFTIVLCSTSVLAQRGLSIGYIDMEYILDNIPEYRQASQMLEQKIQDWKGEIAMKQTEIDNLKEQLENERPLLTPELIEEKEDEIAYLQEQLLKYQETKFGASGEFIVQKRQLIQPIEDQVFNAVQEIGRVRDYDFIFENSAEALMLFSAERHDISDRVLKMINRSERSERRDEKEKEKNPLKDMKDEPYKSVKDAKEDKKKEEEREKEISERERKRDSIKEARKSIRDSIRNARQEAFEQRRQEAQRRRDSIRKARENNK